MNKERTTDAKDAKEMVRKEMRLLRDALSSQRQRAACKGVFEHFKDFLGIVLSFSSFGSEIDLWPLNDHLMTRGRLALPKITKDGSLVPYQITSKAQLSKSSLGLLEPNHLATPLQLDKLSLILVPALGFDKTGHRIGYGKGHFDRFLSEGFDTKTIGVGFKEQLLEKPIEVEEFDQKLDSLCLF